MNSKSLENCDIVCVFTCLAVCEKNTIGVLMLTSNLIIVQLVNKLFNKSQNFLVPRNVLHRQRSRFRRSTIRDALHFDEIRVPKWNQVRIALYLFRVPCFDQRQSINSPNFLTKQDKIAHDSRGCFTMNRNKETYSFVQRFQTVDETLPEVPEQRSVNFLQAVFRAGVDADV